MLQILDDLEYAATILVEVQALCLAEAEISGPIDDNGQQSLPPDIIDKLCPSDCSSHGNCTAGNQLHPYSSILCMYVYIYIYMHVKGIAQV